MRKVRIILSVVALVSAVAGSFASVMSKSTLIDYRGSATDVSCTTGTLVVSSSSGTCPGGVNACKVAIVGSEVNVNAFPTDPTGSGACEGTPYTYN